MLFWQIFDKSSHSIGEISLLHNTFDTDSRDCESFPVCLTEYPALRLRVVWEAREVKHSTT